MKIKTKREICAAVAVVAFVAMLGAAGAMEDLQEPISSGALRVIAAGAVSAAAGWKAGFFNR